MLAPATSIYDVVFVRVTWTAADPNSDPLDAYEVLILTEDGETYAAETSSCDGSDADVLSNNLCDIPLTTLRQAPFNL